MGLAVFLFWSYFRVVHGNRSNQESKFDFLATLRSPCNFRKVLMQSHNSSTYPSLVVKLHLWAWRPHGRQFWSSRATGDPPLGGGALYCPPAA